MSTETALLSTIRRTAISKAWDMAPATCMKVTVTFQASGGNVLARADWRDHRADCNDGEFFTVIEGLSEAEARRLAGELNGGVQVARAA